MSRTLHGAASKVFCCIATTFVICCVNASPESFLGLRLGDHVEKSVQPFDTNERYFGFKVALSASFLDYDQCFLHATLKSRTISSISAGRVFNDYNAALKSTRRAQAWVLSEYGIEPHEVVSSKNRSVWSFGFDNETDDYRYFLVEINSPTDGMWCSFISYYSSNLEELQIKEASEVDYRAVKNPGVMVTLPSRFGTRCVPN